MTAQIQDARGSGTVTVSPARDAEVFVRRSGGGWARVSSPVTIDEDYEIKAIGSPQQIAGSIEYKDYYGKYAGATYLQTGAYIRLKEAPRAIEEPGMPINMETARIAIELFKGALFADIIPKQITKFECNTSVSVIGVKGTKFYVGHDEAENVDTIKVYEGIAEVKSNSGRADVSANEMVSVTSAGHSAPAPFDPSQDKTPWGQECCASAYLLGFAALGSFALGNPQGMSNKGCKERNKYAD
ncbi:MAG: hypothetical protein QXH30_01445 [Candidatus Bilamarchaeaceae archaeon]